MLQIYLPPLEAKAAPVEFGVALRKADVPFEVSRAFRFVDRPLGTPERVIVYAYKSYTYPLILIRAEFVFLYVLPAVTGGPESVFQ